MRNYFVVICVQNVKETMGAVWYIKMSRVLTEWSIICRAPQQNNQAVVKLVARKHDWKQDEVFSFGTRAVGSPERESNLTFHARIKLGMGAVSVIIRVEIHNCGGWTFFLHYKGVFSQKNDQIWKFSNKWEIFFYIRFF